MKRWLWVLTMSVALFAGQAEAAKRMGGGKSFGQQSSNVTQRQATPPPAAPAPGAANTAVKSPAAQSFFATSGSEPWTSTPQELAQFQAAETKKWGQVIKAAGIEPE